MQEATIAAIATAPGAGGIAVVRLSGAESYQVAARVFCPANAAKKFSRKKDACIICINDNVKDAAEEIVRGICDESGYNVRFILKRSSNNYL